MTSITKESILRKLKEKNSSLFYRGAKATRRGNQFILIDLLEEELLRSKQSDEKEKVEVIKEMLWDRYERRGFRKKGTTEYLNALFEGRTEDCKRITREVAARLEKKEDFVKAAQEYFEAEEYEKAAETWIKEGYKDYSDGREFIYAAECLIEGGMKKKEAYRKIAEEVEKSIRYKEEKYGWWSDSKTYFVWEECLRKADNREAALKVKQAGSRKEEVEALWLAGDYLAAARIAHEVTKNKQVFYNAAQKYEKRSDYHFFQKVWKYVERNFVFLKEDGKEKKLEKTHSIIVLLHSVYGLPIPPKIDKKVLSLKKEKNRSLANALYSRFMQKKKIIEKSEFPKLLSEFLLSRALEYAALGDLNTHKIKEILLENFAGMPKKRPPEFPSSPELQEIWQELIEFEKEILGYDPIEMAGRAYEEGEYYKEAKEKYLEANLSKDAERVDELINTSSKPL